MTNKIKPYKKALEFSYATSAYVVIEMLRYKPDIVINVYVHSNFVDKLGLAELCHANNIPIIYSNKAFNLINQKQNCYVIGVFRKYETTLQSDKPHIVLVNPSDMGNIGTIIRTAAGFNIKNIAIITPAVDIFDPKTIRASMGSIFRINFQLYADFPRYVSAYGEHNLFPFMLDGTASLNECEPCLFSLIFGNEASGLGKTFAHIGKSVKIPISGEIDSLNLSIAAGIGMYVFSTMNNL